MNIGSIAFDGMHRSGKGTQIELLQKRISNLGINNITVRGEHYRTGNGEDILENPYSEWWQNNIYNTNYEEKSNRLNRELYILYKRVYPNYLKSKNIENGIILQDRSIVGNYLFKAGEGLNIKNINTFKYGKNNLINNTIIPELIFILKPDKSILLERLYSSYNQNNDNAEGRLKYKEKYITEKYDNYYNGINYISEEIKKNIVFILGNNTKEKIHQQVRNIIQEKYSGIISSADVNNKKVYNKNQEKNDIIC